MVGGGLDGGWGIGMGLEMEGGGLVEESRGVGL